MKHKRAADTAVMEAAACNHNCMKNL